MLDKQQLQAILLKAQEVAKDPRRFSGFKDDPIAFARDILGIRRQAHQPEEFFPNDCGLWTKQQAILTLAATHDRIAVKSGHITGKSFTLAILIAWWHLARQGRVLSTGPTREHIEDVLWPELHMLHAKSLVPLPGQLDKLDWKQDNYWYATGITTDRAGAFQGRHHPRLLGIMDEAAGIEDLIHTEMATCCGAQNNTIFMVANPTMTSGKFYEAFKMPDIWALETISCLEHPNVLTGEELIPGAISRKQVESWRREWGETHPFWYSRVLGEFPLISERGVIPLLWLNRAQDLAQWETALRQAEKDRLPRNAGLDIARYGQNKCVFTLRRGDAIEHIESWGHASTMHTTGYLIELQRKWQFTAVAIDASGLGAPVADRLFEQNLPFRVHAYNGGRTAFRKSLYGNRRCEMWLHLRHRMEKSRLWLKPARMDPEVDRLCADLLAVNFRDMSSGGRMQIETKEQLMDRGVTSPDWADSLTMCFALLDDPEADLEVSTVSRHQDPEAAKPLKLVDDTQDAHFASLPHGF